MYRVAVALLLLSVALARPLTGLYLSNGLSCTPFPTDQCVACGSAFYQCSFHEDDDGESYGCTSSTMSDCSGATSYPLEPFCSQSACSFTTISNYQFEASAPSGDIVFEYADMTGEVLINSTYISTTALHNMVIATPSSSRGVLFIEDGVFDDNTYLTNKGKCTVGDWCDADPALSYRLVPMPTNGTLPAYSRADAAGGVAVYVDGGTPFISASEQVKMLWYERRLIADANQLEHVSVHFWPSSVVWSNFQIEEMNSSGEDPVIVWEVSAGQDFTVYRDDQCDENDNEILACHLDFNFSFSDWFGNPFPPFFSFSFEAEEEVNDDEWTFSLFH